MLGRAMVTAVAVAATVALAGSTAGAAAGLDRVGAAPAIPLFSGVSPLADSTQLHVTVSMRPQDPGGLQALATSISSPGSPDFRHYLTVAQFADRFGATAAALSAVESQLGGSGLNVGPVPANHLTIPATGTAAQIERAFSVQLEQVKLASGRTAFANAQAPALPASIAPYVQGIVGLDDLYPPRPAGLEMAKRGRPTDPSMRPAAAVALKPEVRPRIVTGGPQPCSDATDEQLSFEGEFGVPTFPQTADEAAAAYAFPPLYQAGDLGAGQTVALFELQPYAPTDIATYQTCYGTTVPITNVEVDGASATCTSPCSPDGDGEAALDIEQVIGLAPQANVLVYEAPSTLNGIVDLFSAIVSQDKAQEISSSFGTCESVTGGSLIAGENTLLQEAATQGQSFFASSGDSGAEMCSQLGGLHPNFDLSVEDPSGQPFATGVGGTSLTSFGSPPTEAVWNDGPNPECGCVNTPGFGGTGGGISEEWPMPGYQSGAAPALGVTNPDSSASPCGGGGSDCREVPDVSADGDLLTGYVIFDEGHWDVIGGTSASTPLWAAYMALVNASAACRGQSIGFASPALYQVAGRNYAANFNDVTAASPYTGLANNDTFDGSGMSGVDPGNLFPLRTGYDMATGLGTPVGSTLAAWLCGIRYGVSVTNPGSQSTVVGHPVALAIQAGDSGAVGLSYAASALPAGLSINAATGLISGTPTTPGTSTVAVSATDAFANNGATQFSWTVIQPGLPLVTGKSLKGLKRRNAKLRFTVHAGSNAPALEGVKISLPAGISFAKTHKNLLKGISVKGAQFKVKLIGKTVTLTLAGAVQQVTIAVSAPAITVTKTLAAKARHPKHRTVTVAVTVIDASGQAIALPQKLPL